MKQTARLKDLGWLGDGFRRHTFLSKHSIELAICLCVLQKRTKREHIIMHADEILEELRYRLLLVNPGQECQWLGALKYQRPANAAFEMAVFVFPDDNIYLQERSRVLLKHEPNGQVEIYPTHPSFHKHVCSLDADYTSILKDYYPMAGKSRLADLRRKLIVTSEDALNGTMEICIPIELGFCQLNLGRR